MNVVDTHLHLWDTRKFSYSWLHDYPALNRPYVIDDYASDTQGGEIIKAVYVDTDVDSDDMARELAWILELAENPETVLAGVVACAKLEQRDFRNYIDAFAGHPLLKGVRRILHSQPDHVSRTPQFRENLKSLSGYGLSFDLCVLSRQLPIAIELAAYCPEVSFILDHCGNPNVQEHVLQPWANDIRELARYDNVSCKISGLVARVGSGGWTVNDMRPFIEHCIACFGWERVVWGSDWPLCTQDASVLRWLNCVTSIVKTASSHERQKTLQRQCGTLV